MHEIKVLKQLKDANTKNVNMIFDAFQIHSQLWIVNEYCPGGSVRTLVSLVFLDLLIPYSKLVFYLLIVQITNFHSVYEAFSSQRALGLSI